MPVEVSALLLGVVRRSQLQAVADLDTTPSSRQPS